MSNKNTNQFRKINKTNSLYAEKTKTLILWSMKQGTSEKNNFNEI